MIRQDQSFRLYPGRCLQKMCDHTIIVQLPSHCTHTLLIVIVSIFVRHQLCPRPVLRGFTFLILTRVCSCELPFSHTLQDFLHVLSVFCALFGCVSAHSRARNSLHVTKQLHVQVRPEYQVFPGSASLSPLCQQPCDHQQNASQFK